VGNGDPSKRKAYVWADLVIKSISALALVLLGIAGWFLQSTTQKEQSTTQKEHERLETRERESRVFLPAFRALTELEFATDDAAVILRRADRFEAANAINLTSRLNAVALSAYVAGHDMAIPIELPGIQEGVGSAKSVRVKVGVRAAGLMLADLLKILSIAHTIEQRPARPGYPNPGFRDVRFVETVRSKATHRTEVGAFAMLTKRDDGQVWAPINAESLGAWRAWNGAEPGSYWLLGFALPGVAESVHQQSIAAAAELVRQHPELGEKFVAIRNEVISQHAKDSEIPVRAHDNSQGARSG